MNLWSLNYWPHDRFVAPARAAPQLWRLLLGMVLAAGFFLVLSQVVFGTLFGLMSPEMVERITTEGSSGQTAGGMFVLLSQLGLLAVAAGLVCVVVHKRGPLSLIGPIGLAGRQFVAVVAGLIVLMIVLAILPPYDFSGGLSQNMSVGRWLVLLPFALLAVLVQSGAEEVLFRGYLQQQLAARFKSPVIWIVGPSVVFGSLHYYPETAGSNATTIALWATVFGMLMADLTARAGTLGPAVAVHFVNNVSAIVLISVPDEMSGLALYVLPFGVADEAQMAMWLPVDFGFMLVSWLVARLAIRA
jgi:hypothetical protein